MTVKSIIRRVLAGPSFNIMYYYKLKHNELNKEFLQLKNIDYEILTQETSEKVLEIRERNVEITFRNICDKQRVILTKYKGEIAGHAALKFPEDNYSGKYWKKYAYSHYCYVAPRFRGKNIYPYMLAILSELGYQHNCNDVFISVDKRNISSIRGIEKVGYKKSRTGIVIGWGGITIFRIIL